MGSGQRCTCWVGNLWAKIVAGRGRDGHSGCGLPWLPGQVSVAEIPIQHTRHSRSLPPPPAALGLPHLLDVLPRLPVQCVDSVQRSIQV